MSIITTNGKILRAASDEPRWVSDYVSWQFERASTSHRSYRQEMFNNVFLNPGERFVGFLRVWVPMQNIENSTCHIGLYASRSGGGSELVAGLYPATPDYNSSLDGKMTVSISVPVTQSFRENEVWHDFNKSQLGAIIGGDFDAGYCGVEINGYVYKIKEGE